MFEVSAIIDLVNALVLVALLVEGGVILYSLARRYRLYRQAKITPDPLLRRSIGLIGGLFLLGIELAVIRYLEVVFEPDSIERLLFIIQSSLLIVVPLGYYAKVEYTLDDPI